MIRVTDHGADALVARLARMAASPLASEVGVIGDDAGAEHGADLTTADVALFHELGLGVPRRSWLADAITENEALIAQTLAEFDKRIVLGQIEERVALDQFGAWLVGLIQQRIANGISPPLADSTEARKGSSTPLIDTGQLRSSITNRTVENT